MPKHLQWMNEGKFDGAALNKSTQELRNFYGQLLKLINRSNAISSGKFYDLQYVNRHHLSEGFNEKYLYAYLRYNEQERVIVIANFNKEESYEVYLKIPQDALALMKCNTQKSFVFYDMLNEEEIGVFQSEEFTVLNERHKGIRIPMKANAARIIRF